MNGAEIIDIYCERMGPGLWAEPVNLLTNLAFLVAAWICLRRIGSMSWPVGRSLAVTMVLIGLTSGLWHSIATGPMAAADSLSILAFVVIFVAATHREVLGWRLWTSIAVVPVFLAYALAIGIGAAQLPFFAISAVYWPIPLALCLYAIVLRKDHPETARGFVLGAGILILSLIARSIDEGLCAAWPHGTHFLWHILNAIMLGWMVEVLRQHRLAGPRAQG